jgi:hypothetical protein
MGAITIQSTDEKKVLLAALACYWKQLRPNGDVPANADAEKVSQLVERLEQRIKRPLTQPVCS